MTRFQAMVRVVLACVAAAAGVVAQTTEPPPDPVMSRTDLRVRTVRTGFALPTGLAFLGADDYFVTEKNTGRVKRVRQGTETTVLDLGVNNASERGLLGIALHPNFPTDPGVYLFWTCRSSRFPTTPQFADDRACFDADMFLPDTNNVDIVPILGNRVDRFEWNGERLTYSRNLIMLRAFQADGAPTPAGQGDETQPGRGNHDGGVITFGPDGKLYIIVGDVGRRGRLQNLADGPTPPTPDDQYGGPEPDNEHLTGVVLRLNPDGTTPADNPFFAHGASVGGEVGNAIQRVFAYGIRNSFGMAFDPVSGQLWETEHGDDMFDEINRIRPGHNGGWVQFMGPAGRIFQYKAIETSRPGGLQQLRWPPDRIADTPQAAMERLVMLPGATYVDPQFSWSYATLPVALNFAPAQLGSIGRQLVVGLASGTGHLLAFRLSENRLFLEMGDIRTTDRVADNKDKQDMAESEPFVIGSNFGIVTDIKPSPRNTLYVVSHMSGNIYEVMRSDDTGALPATPMTLYAELSGSNEVPAADDDGSGRSVVRLDPAQGQVCFDLTVTGIAPANAAHIHRGAAGVNGPVVVPFTAPTTGSSSGCTAVTAALLAEIAANPANFYVNVHNADFPGGAVRGQLSATPGPLQAFLSGANENPPADVDGSGRSTVRLEPAQGRVCYELTVANIATATAAHIHRGAANVNGPVVVPFDAPATGSSSGCTNATAELIAEIAANPANFYVNVHNADYPGGAVRGQLGSSAAPLPPLRAFLSGVNENPAADADGSGAATVRLDLQQGQVCYELTVSNIGTPTAAHIHRGGPTVNGPVVVPFATPAEGSSSGCANATPALLNEIAANPGNFYVNVHNAEFPGGAVRGQLGSASEPFPALRAFLSGANENPPADPDGSGRSSVRLDFAAGQACYEVTVANIGTPTAAHIHRGAAAVNGPVIVPFATPAEGSSSGCANVTAALLNEIAANPANFYVNVHNAEFPGGAVRGQLASASAPLPALQAELSGANENPPADADGTGRSTVRLDVEQSQVCYELTVANIGTPTAAHIHRGGSTVNGPVVVPFTTPASGSSSGCANIAAALLNEIAANPGNFYVNVHNAEFPGGAVRGQLSAGR